MRKLLVTRGAQGAGKTHFAHTLRLHDHVLSADAIRQITAAPVLTVSGRFGTSQDHDARVWKQLMQLCDERMGRGELLIVDATHPNAKAFEPYLELAHKHRYELRCVDFAGVPLERCLKQNRLRDDPWFVPEGVIKKTWAACADPELISAIAALGVESIPWREDLGHVDEVQAWLDEPILDLSSYAAVVHIGDLQGCFTPLRMLLDPTEEDGGIRAENFYIFIGDLCDRGDENAEVVQFALQHMHEDNVVFLWGNHEEHLHRWARGLDPVSTEFDERTRPQLEAGGITPAMLDPLCDRLRDVVRYTFRGHRVMACHAGMSTVPKMPARVSSRQWANGVGFYAEAIDPIFTERAPEGWVQVHGHRNIHSLPTRAAERSFNLEGKVEFGGDLRVVVLDGMGWHERAIRNPVFRPIQKVVAAGKLRHAKSHPQWVTADMADAPAEGAEMLPVLRAHPLIYERPSSSVPHISAFNFTREAFFDAAWDETNVRARGLFLDNETGRILARSYDKFFNLGERPETQLDAICERFVFPVDVWLKENGYLGIVGFDHRTQELVFTSKSSLESDFAGWLKTRVEETLGEGGLQTLRRYVRDAQASLVFEVVEPVHDPHIVAYDAPVLVLLDVVRRAEKFERMDYDRLQKLGQWLGFQVKQRAARLPSERALRGYLGQALEDDERQVEGYVLEDAAGAQVKIKLPYYQFWKRMRSLKDRVLKTRGSNQPLQRDLSDPRVAAFHAWLTECSDETLKLGIVELRAMYLDGHVPPPRIGEAKPDPKVRGFERALEGLEGEALKPATAEKLLEKALAHDGILAMLRERPERVALVLACPEGDTRTEAAERLNVDVA